MFKSFLITFVLIGASILAKPVYADYLDLSATGIVSAKLA